MSDFIISGKETKELQKWLKKHDKKCRFADPIKQGAISGRLTYMFNPTSIGLLIKVKCACGKKKLLTDFTDW